MEEETLVTGAGQDNTATGGGTKETQTATIQNQTSATSATESKATETKLKAEGTLLTTAGKEGKPETADASGKETKATKAPEEYKDFNLPEGIEVDQEGMAEFKMIAKEIGLTQEQAQRLVDLQAKMLLKQVDAQMALLKKMDAEWVGAIKKEYGDKLAEELVYVAKTRDLFAREHPEAAKELVQLLEDSRLGNHPALFKLFAFIGRAIAEDKFEFGKPAAQILDARVLYPNSNMNP